MRLACLTILLLPCMAVAQIKGTDYAFIVAVKNYQEKNGLPSLPHAITDVEGFRSALLETGYEKENIIVLHDELTPDQNPGFAKLPEKAKIIDQLGGLMRLLDPEDSVVVVFNGHGVHFKGADTSHFCPLDADLSRKRNLIAMDGEGSLFAMLKACKAKRKLLIAGMCRNDPGELPNNAQAAEKIDLSRPERVPEGLKAFYSCEPGQKTYFDKKEGSYFFKHLNAAWRGEYTTSDEITMDELLYLVHKKTKKDVFGQLTREQYPDAQGISKGFWVVPKSQFMMEVVFVIGTTKSMTSGLKLLKEVVEELNKLIAKRAGGKRRIRFGLVTYHDGSTREEPAEVVSRLTSDLPTFASRLKEVSAIHEQGVDIQQDVLAGLVLAIQQAGWVENSSKHIVLLGNASAHLTGPKNSTGKTLREVIGLAQPEAGDSATRSIMFHSVRLIAKEFSEDWEECQRQFHQLSHNNSNLLGYCGEFNLEVESHRSRAFDETFNLLKSGIDAMFSYEDLRSRE